MFAVLANAAAIVGGTFCGLLFRRFMTEELGRRMQLMFGFISLVIGLRMALKFENVLVFIGCLAAGAATGWLLNLEYYIELSAKKLHHLVTRGRESSFVTGLIVSSILFCVGGMAIVGSINSGVMGDNDILYTKALLDGITSAVLAAIYGVSVAFSAVPVLLYEGAIALMASKAVSLNRPHVLAEISGVGGVLVMMIGIHLAKIQKIAVGDFLPALLFVLTWAFFV